MSLVYKRVMEVLQRKETFSRVLDKVKILNLENGTCTAEMKIEKEHTNILGTLHGGMTATIVDAVSSFAILSHPKVDGIKWTPVSINLQTNYMRRAAVEDVIDICARTLHIGSGKKIGFLEVEIKNGKDQKLLVKGFHTVILISHDSNKL